MRVLSLGSRSLAAIALVALVAGCHDPEKTPTGPSNPSDPQEVTVEISGPATMTLGASAQFRVTVHSSNSANEVPPTVKWIASPSSFLQVDTSGLVTAGPAIGGAVITVVVQSGTYEKQVSKAVAVVAGGAFFLTGTVSDAEFPTSPIVGARVELTPGPPAQTTGSDGRYGLYGVQPNSTIRVTADGYEPQTLSLTLGWGVTQNFLLTSSRPHLSFAGLYTLAIDVTDGCSSPHPLSADLQHRSYDATLTQRGLTVDVLLTEPRFSINGGQGNRFSGHVDLDGVTFKLGEYAEVWDWGSIETYPDVAEHLSDRTYLVPSGTTVTIGSSAGLTGVLVGYLENFDSRFPDNAPSLGVCPLPRFTLTPRSESGTSRQRSR
jgi:hypothetical protein